jgi:hypothetical protein
MLARSLKTTYQTACWDTETEQEKCPAESERHKTEKEGMIA